MTSIIKQYDKKTGKTYAVESTSRWDKERKTCICDRKVIGHFDPETGEILPNRKRKESTKQTAIAKSAGCSLLFDHAGEKTGLVSALKKVYPNHWEKLLTCAYYLLAEGNALSHCEQWTERNITPLNQRFPAQRIFEMLPDFNRDTQMEFFQYWAHKIRENEYFALDITSVSSYSSLIKTVKYGYNRDKENLEQINLGMVVGIKTGIPVYFHTYPGSIHDVSTLQQNLTVFDWLAYKKLHLVMDRGFCSKTNVSDLYAHGLRFTIALSKSLSFTTDAIDEVRSSIHTYSHREVIADEELFVETSLKEWDGHRCYTHVYYDPRKVSEEESKFYRNIDVYYQELRSEKLNPEHQKFYDRFFTIERKQHVGRVVMPNDEAILAFQNKYAGYSVIISNDLKDPVEALMVYRAKDRVEKSFDNLKNDLDGKRLRVRSEWAMEGRMFVQFLSLILASYIQRVMREKDLYKNYTMQSIIEEMKILMRITLPRSRKVLYSELTADQKRICEAFGIEAGA